jgi:hypothetical protein
MPNTAALHSAKLDRPIAAKPFSRRQIREFPRGECMDFAVVECRPIHGVRRLLPDRWATHDPCVLDTFLAVVRFVAVTVARSPRRRAE